VKALQGGAVEDVGGDAEGFGTTFFEAISDGFDGLLRSRGSDDIRSCGRQTEGYGFPDAGGSTDNNGAFPCKTKHTYPWPSVRFFLLLVKPLGLLLQLNRAVTEIWSLGSFHRANISVYAFIFNNL
jgi:hypothetical protein